jgi:hypothetical protein
LPPLRRDVQEDQQSGGAARTFSTEDPTTMENENRKHQLGAALEAIVEGMGSLFARGQAIDGEHLEWQEIEQLLTDGYALALAMEAERARVGATLAGIERDIRWLRSVLDELHVHGKRLRPPVLAESHV